MAHPTAIAGAPSRRRAFLLFAFVTTVAAGCIDGGPELDDETDPGAAFEDAYGKFDVFGEDTRREPYEMEGLPDAVEWGRATALRVRGFNVECPPDEPDAPCTLKVETLQEYRNLCTDPPQAFAEQPRVSGCTVFLVTPRIFVTAGHCVDNPDAFCQDYKFVFDFAYYTGEEEDITTVPRENVYSCSRVIERRYETAYDYTTDPEATDSRAKYPIMDFAVVELDRDVVGRTPLPIRREGELEVGDDIVLVGYPSGLPLKFAEGHALAFPEDRNYIVTDADSLPGNSGSPVLSVADGVVEGIHSFGVPGNAYETITTDDGECSVLASACEEIDFDDPGCRGNLEFRTSFFEPYVPTCHARCGGDFTLPETEEPTCRCDAECRERGDCCWDYSALCE